MNKTVLKILVLALLLGVGTGLWVSSLNALPATWCYGTDGCENTENACLEGEFLFANRIGTFCYSWYICRSQFRVTCWDFDDHWFYYRGASCDSWVVGSDKCNPNE